MPFLAPCRCAGLSRILLILAAMLTLNSCALRPQECHYSPQESPAIDPIAALLDIHAVSVPDQPPLKKLGHTIQVGAFANLDNAVRLEQLLDTHGLDAYYFRHESGLYKVRFGNHDSFQTAQTEAEALKAQNVINEYYIVIPEDYAVARLPKTGQGDLREELVQTARRFLGTPYRWGGTGRDEGFDCSGLTMVCYRLNGLNLPRASTNQFENGQDISRGCLQKGDLVFFATNGGHKVSHVGIYIGDDRFIHAPRAGQPVQIEELSHPYYSKTFVGCRSYL